MTTYTITSGYDSYVWGLAGSTNFNGKAFVNTGATGGQPQLGFVYLPIPSDVIGQTIASATLTGVSISAEAAATVGVVPVLGPWSAATITYSNKPSLGSATNTSVPITAAGGTVVLDCTAIVQNVSSGAAWYGLQLQSGSTTYGFNSFESGLTSWTLTIVTSDAPDTPQSLVPNGTVVASGAPVLTCDFEDNGGLSADMAAIQVLVYSNPVGSPVYDSGTVSATVPVFDLSAHSFSAVSSGTTRYWKVRVQDADGNWSAYSDMASWTYRSQPALTLLTPAAGVLWDPTSDVVATFGANLSRYRVQITDANDRTAVRFDSGLTPANPAALTNITVSLPEEYHNHRVLVDDRNYQLHIRAWDTYTDRQSTPGSPAYVDSWTTFHFDDDGTLTPVSSLTAIQPDAGPSVRLTWTRGSAGDAWVVLRDSKVVARLSPADVITGVSSWSWTDPHPDPWVKHTYKVKAISGTPPKQSPPGPTVSITPELDGIWLFTQDGQQVRIDGDPSGGTGVDQLAVTDRRAIYKPLNLPYDVDIVTGFEGLSGTVTGTISTTIDGFQTMDVARAVLFSIKSKPSTWVTLVFGRFSGRVLLRNVSVVPHVASQETHQLMRVSFGVNQVGDFDSVM